MKQSTELVIRVRQDEYKRAMDNFNKKLDVQGRMTEQYKMLLKDYTYNEDKLYADPVDYFFKSVEDAYSKENTLRLSGIKLVELLQLNADKFRVEAYKYNDLKKFNEPTIAQFTDYAETEEELSRLTYANTLIDLIRTFEKDLGGRAFPKEIILSHSPQVLFFNYRTNTYEANIQFIKKTIQRGI